MKKFLLILGLLFSFSCFSQTVTFNLGNDWKSGFYAYITIVSSEPISDWRVELDILNSEGTFSCSSPNITLERTTNKLIFHGGSPLSTSDNNMIHFQLDGIAWEDRSAADYMLGTTPVVAFYSNTGGTDTDGDGTPDDLDGCPNDANKIAPGACGCGYLDTDTDGDGVADCIDICQGSDDTADMDTDGVPDGCDNDIDGDGVDNASDCNPTNENITTGSTYYADTDGDGYGNAAASTVACTQPVGYVLNSTDCDDTNGSIYPGATEVANDGIDQDCNGSDLVQVIDTDGDGTPDNEDGCPNDANKIAPGACGCGNLDTDTDGDGVADCIDICEGSDDNADFDGDGSPDGCDDDDDNDGILDVDDDYPFDPTNGNTGSTGSLIQDVDADTKITTEETGDVDNIFFYTAGAKRLTLTETGQVGINTETVPEGYILGVNGSIATTRIVVQTASDWLWPDYVFNKDYSLLPLSELESFIKNNSHLPEVPNENDIKNNGVDVAEMDAVLLKKVEELTLYLIELNKELQEQKQITKEQQRIINELSKGSE